MQTKGPVRQKDSRHREQQKAAKEEMDRKEGPRLKLLRYRGMRPTYCTTPGSPRTRSNANSAERQTVVLVSMTSHEDGM